MEKCSILTYGVVTAMQVQCGKRRQKKRIFSSRRHDEKTHKAHEGSVAITKVFSRSEELYGMKYNNYIDS